MKKIYIAIIVTFLLFIGCSSESKIVSKNDTVTNTGKSNDITEQDLERVKNIMLLKFTTPDIPSVMAITFRDFEKLDEIIEIEGYKDRKDAIAKLKDAYKLSPISENTDTFLSKFEVGNIEAVFKGNGVVEASIELVDEGGTNTLDSKFKRNEDDQWYMVGNLENIYETLNRQGYLE